MVIRFAIKHRREDFQEALDVYEQLLKSSINQKETAELHYKIGNVQLLQALPDCESKALKHLQISFQQCVEAQRLELGYYDLNQLKSIQSVRERLTSTYPESEQITLLVLLLEKIEDTLQQQLENRECKQEIERWRNQKFQLDGDSNRLPVTEDRFEKAEPKQVIKLGVFGSAARQRQNVEAYDSVGKRVKQE